MSSKDSVKDQLKFISVGYIKSAHGIRGEVSAQIPSGEWTWAVADRLVYLGPRTLGEFNGSELKPYSIEKYRAHKTGLIIKFKEVLDRNHAEDLKGQTLYIDEQHFVSQPGEKIFLHEVLDFKVYDKELALGKVIGFMDNGAQDLLRVKDEKQSEKEHLIPFIEVFIERIDFKSQEIHMSLPEGLIE